MRFTDRYVGRAGLAVLVIVGAAIPAFGQEAAKGPTADVVACPPAVAAVATCYGAKLETGAYLTAAMPKTWNGTLVVFGHGGPFLDPPNATTGMRDLERLSFAVRRGFAWIASSYRRGGYGVAFAVEDENDARKFFVEHVGKPQHTVYHGQSYGGLVGTKLIEKYAKGPDGSPLFEGAFFNSGAVTGSTLNYEHRADLRAVYEYYCQNMPRPQEAKYPLWNGVAPDSRMTLKDLDALVDECTGVGKPAAARTDQQKQNLANILNVMGYPEGLLVRHMQAATLLFRDIVKNTTGGKSPFSNIGVQYHGSSDDAALNRDVPRFAADPEAVAALKADGDPTGILAVPVVSIHSMNDPQVVVEAQSVYRDKVAAAGSAARLVQAYTDERGHGAQSSPELAAGLEGLMGWILNGTKPTPQSIAAACEQLKASLDGPCRYHPDFSPKPFNTHYYPREAALR